MSSKDYCGIVFVGGGSSWAWAGSPEDAGKAAAKQCRKDWGRYFNLPKKLKVCIYDMKEHDGWEADDRGVVDSKTGEPLKRHSLVEV